MRACVCVCVCVAKPVAVELRCHATALILVIGKAQFRRAMLSCDSSCSIPSCNLYLEILKRLHHSINIINNDVSFIHLSFFNRGIKPEGPCEC